ncbi:MAG: clostripain-related cysteine peptidase [Candidatus Riflebacteria bacterium]
MKRVMSIFVLALIAFAFCSPAAAAEKEWTFMVFLNADNNLDSYGADDLQEMAQGGGSNEFRNIVCLIDREHGPATLNYVNPTGPEVVKDMGELDMGDYKEFVKFVTETAKAYPAKNYAAVIWNHGSGWKDAHGDIIKGISYDDSSNNHITTGQLTIALKEIEANLGKKLDILGFDACLMQMIEVAYAVKDHAAYLVGSEETEPGEGWCYDDLGKAWKKGLNAAELASLIVAEYAASYDGGSAGSSSTTQSALDCSKINNLRDAINGLCKTVIAGNFSAEFKAALNSVQKFYYRTNIDLGHFAKLTKNTIKDEAYQTAVTKLEKALEEVVVKNGLSGYNTKNATGLAVYFPTSSYSFAAQYKELAFAQETMWEQMVKDYYVKASAKKILAGVAVGNVDALREYVATANEKNRSVSNELISQINFAVFAEGNVDADTQNSVRTLVNELKNK